MCHPYARCDAVGTSMWHRCCLETNIVVAAMFLRPEPGDGARTGTGTGAGDEGERRSEVAAAGLLALDGLEQGLEVALAEPLRAVPLDQLEEHRRPVLHGPGEDLEQVAVLVAVGEYAQVAKDVDGHPGVADPLAKRVVVAVR